MYYDELDMRGIKTEVINFIIELLARYSLTPTELARIVASEFGISATKTLIDLCVDQHNKHKR